MAEKLALKSNHSLTPKYTEIVELTRDFCNHYNVVVFFRMLFQLDLKACITLTSQLYLIMSLPL